MASKWQKIHQRIIKRQIPHAILSWRYFLPKQNKMVHLHRKTFLHAWADYPRIVWCLIALYSYSVWYLFYAWRQVFRIWQRRKEALAKEQNISPWQQLKGLLTLALLHTIPPHFYYQYRLHRYPERKWLNFIYTHELPHWHQMMSPNISEHSRKLMSHKHDFALEMTKLGLPAIPSIQLIKKGEKIAQQRLFNQQSLFLKPECGSRKEGCYLLSYQAETEQYYLKGANVDGKLTQTEIKRFIEKIASKQDYLIQPLLENHPLITQHCQCEQLVTLRLITKFESAKARTISAVFEAPAHGAFDRIIPIAIEIDTGTLLAPSPKLQHVDSGEQGPIPSLTGFILPFWHDLMQVAEHAHQHVPDIDSLGWDLAITPEGVKLIEGNINWAVTPHQLDGYRFLIF